MSLNSKKSWNPTKRSNIAKIEAKERSARGEKLDQENSARKDVEDDEFNRLASNLQDGKPVPNKISWMYAPNPNTSPSFDLSEANEEILIGKRKIDYSHKEAQRKEERQIRISNRKLAADPLALLNATNESQSRGSTSRTTRKARNAHNTHDSNSNPKFTDSRVRKSNYTRKER
ncbi:hypothetical protein DASB73_001860 [Starmerella bacillaris]|uniref:Pre-mRNA-splicing factor CWC25 n=1 Tax=Starmerella bacillaris TaxID=1247836 RepID=A0AAV5REQ6_STABA|nr:hypothetical protein DASB73_001860 [Starmerella bacillaris]